MAGVVVVDCSIAAKWILPEPGREKALSLLDAYQEGRTLLVAPDHLHAECASLLARRVRSETLTAGQALRAFHLLTCCAPRLIDFRPLLQPALELSLRHSLSLWDCVYIALGTMQDCPVVTADLRRRRSGKPRYPRLQLLQ